ncbi:helix-hairpin-helix domain-containing protein [Cupriavidus sp. OTU4054]|uniref:helix-hairpin-helix domain-containing protein n=1 Tax=unclassified Cupriavidus TaxID=2640874 RepID=UPI00406C3AA0
MVIPLSTHLANGTRVRLGLSLIRGVREESARRIETCRAVRHSDSVTDLATGIARPARRAGPLRRRDALRTLAGNRRHALWQASAAVIEKDVHEVTDLPEEAPALAQPSEGETILGDYRSMGDDVASVSHRPPPSATDQQGFETAATLPGANRQLARGAGKVMCARARGSPTASCC